MRRANPKYPPGEEPWGLYSRLHEPSLGRMFYVEFCSLLGRTFLSGPPRLDPAGPNYLNLGCGQRYAAGFINADQFVYWKPADSFKIKPDWRLDLRYPLPCPDKAFEGVFSEHVLEHLRPPQARALAKELLRILKPGGRLRLVVPDLAKYVDYYRGKPCHEKFSRWPSGCEALRCLTQNFGHVSLYDAEFLGKLLDEAGFAGIAQCQPGQGGLSVLCLDNPKKAWASLYLEALRPA